MNKRKILFIPALPAGTFLGGIAGGSVPATAASAGDWYTVTSAGTSQTITWAVGDRAYYNGSSGSWTKVAGSVNSPGYSAPTAISAAGNTNLALGSGEVNRASKIQVDAGSAAYTHTITLQNTNAVAGAEIMGQVSVAASYNPLIEIRNLTSGGTLLGTVPGDSVARVWGFTARFDGTNWFVTSLQKTRAASIDEVMATANTKSPRPGVAFDGTSGARVTSTLTGQAIGTDPFSVVMTFLVPTSNPGASRGLFVLGPTAGEAATVNNIAGWITTAGALQIAIRQDLAATNSVAAIVSGFVTSYAGKVVTVAAVRATSGNLVIYVNGASVAFTNTPAGSGTWQDTVTSTYFTTGSVGSGGGEFNGPIYPATFYNLALSAADVLEIAESGGAVPYRYRYGSQVSLLTGNNSDFTTAGDWVVTGATTISGGKLNLSSDDQAYILTPFTRKLLTGGRFRVTMTVDSITAGTVQVYTGDLGSWQTFATAAGTATVEYTMNASVGSATPLNLRCSGGNAVIDNISVMYLGAICHFAFDEGIGYQLHDASTNKLDAVMTPTGISHLIPKREGYVRTPGTGISWAGSHEPKNILGAASTQRMLPSEAVVTQIVLKASVASTNGAGLNSTNTASRWSAVAALSTTKSVRTVANSGLPAGTADADTDILLDPDTVNYTGTIQATVQYNLAEG